MTIMPIIDTHLHFWDLALYRYPWLEHPSAASSRVTYKPADWARDHEGLDIRGAVHVQAELDRDLDPVLETAWLKSVWGDCSIPLVHIAHTNPAAVDLEDVLARHMAHGIVRGIRDVAWFHPTAENMQRRNPLENPAWVAGLRRLISRNLSFDLLVYPSQLDQSRSVFRGMQELTVIIEHCGLPHAIGSDERKHWRNALRRFAHEVPMAFLKISGMSLLNYVWSASGLRDHVSECIEIFGVDRCMFGSNFPIEKATIDYKALWQTYSDVTTAFTERERSQLFWKTAAAVYGF